MSENGWTKTTVVREVDGRLEIELPPDVPWTIVRFDSKGLLLEERA